MRKGIDNYNRNYEENYEEKKDALEREQIIADAEEFNRQDAAENYEDCYLTEERGESSAVKTEQCKEDYEDCAAEDKTSEGMAEEALQESISETGRCEEGQNLSPMRDTAKAFEFAEQRYKCSSLHWQEVANRQMESLNKEKMSYEPSLEAARAAMDSDYKVLTDYTNDVNMYHESLSNDDVYQSLMKKHMESKEVYNRLAAKHLECMANITTISNDIIPEMQTTFKGMNGADFESSYDDYITTRQGYAHTDYGGTCGIIETCNIINQQTGSNMSELDGIHEYISKGLCVVDSSYRRNGGTDSVEREAFLKEKGLTFDRVEGAYRDKGEGISLDNVAERFNNGESAGLMLRYQDLSQQQLAGKDGFFSPRFSNHATTIAGFSYDTDGKVTGVWINDTGGWTKSNRVFIDKDKFMQMQRNTKGFAVEFSKKEVE